MREFGETNCELAKCPFGVNVGINCPCASYTDCRTAGVPKALVSKLGTCYTVPSDSTYRPQSNSLLCTFSFPSPQGNSATGIVQYLFASQVVTDASRNTGRLLTSLVASCRCKHIGLVCKVQSTRCNVFSIYLFL